MQARYISEDAVEKVTAQRSPRSTLRVGILGFITSLLALVVVLSGPLQGQVASADDEGFDPIRWGMCVWGDDSIPATIYQTTQSSDLQFETRSKSTMNFGTDRVDNGLNGIMQLFGPEYVDVNKDVLGRATNAEYEDAKDEDEDGEEVEEKEFNSGPQVNPFDRFGVAGLKFTGYTGEWKHVVIDACNPSSDPVDPKSNVYYDDRLEPRSTWEDIPRSKDIRTQQFSKGLPSQYAQSIGNVIANWVFIIPKASVVLTVALINFSFADVGEKLGVVDFLVGDADNPGVFTSVFDNLYIPLLSVVMLIFGIWIMYVGLYKKQIRQAMMGLLRSLLMILVALIIAANPAPFVNAPNAIAVGFQSIILSSMDRSLESQGALCNTDIGSVKTDIDTSDSDDDQETLSEAAENIRSVVGCTFWQMFLVTPWAETQYGTDWNDLWVKDQIPDWAPEDADTLKNTNDEMVGDAAVPLGDGKFIHNWAIFQISAQTDAHSPINDDGGVPRYSSGVSTDWWRIVDAVSNYQETKKDVPGGAISNTGGGGSNTGGEADGAWGGHDNGKIPDDELKAVPYDESHTLREDATDALTEMNEDFKKEFNTDISITDSYRSYEEQVDIKERKPDLAATPGTSNHGWGLALDLGGGINTWDSPERDWMVQNAETYGWVSPEWAQPGNGKEEPWHWEYTGEADGGGGSGGDDSSGAQNEADEKGAYWEPDDKAKPANEWDTWTGNSAWVRVAGASSAALIAGLGLLAPFVLSLLASSAALGSVILMAFAPLMLLLGSGPGHLFEVFKGWLKLVVNLTITRIALGILLVLSIIFTMIAIDTVEDAGWWKGMVLLVLGSILILKARPRFVAMLTDLSFAAQDLSGGMKRISGAVQGAGKAGVRGATTAVAGGVSSKRYGGSFTKGALVGARNELKNQSYRNKGTRSAMATYETLKHNINPGSENVSQEFCARCGKKLGDNSTGRAVIAGRDAAGNYYCQECYEDGAAPEDAREIMLDNKSATKQQSQAETDLKSTRARKSAFQNDTPKEYRDSIVNDAELSDEDRENLLHKVASGVGYEILNYKAALEESEMPGMPEIPEEIRGYLDHSMIEKAWSTQNFEYIQAAYSIAWATWFEETTGQEISGTIRTFVSGVGATADKIREQDSTPYEGRGTFEQEVEESEDAGQEASDKQRGDNE